MSFVCPLCDVVLHDGADYSWCPACSLPVDWVDLSKPLWCCDQCDAFVNETCEDWPACAACDRAMTRVHVRESPQTSSRWSWPRPIALLVPIALLQVTVLACDPVGLVFAAPLLLLVVIGAVWFMITVLRSIGELWALARDTRTRVVHGLEHACATLLERAGRVVVSGQTYRGGFDLEVEHDGRATMDAVRGATDEAIARLTAGDAALARHPRCGTSLLVAGMLIASLVLAAAIVALAGGAAPRVVIAGTTAAIVLAWWSSRPLGLLAQRLLTVSSRFSSAAVRRMKCIVHASGKRATFVVDVDVHLIEPLAQVCRARDAPDRGGAGGARER